MRIITVQQPWAGLLVLGIKKFDFMGIDSEQWLVKLAKSRTDVIAGEGWKGYGFNYA